MPSTILSKSTTTTRLARVPYLNSAPFFRGLSLGKQFELTDAVPRELGRQASSGEISAGLLPLIDFLRLQEQFERLGPFGIAVRGRVRSVLLFSRRPIRQLDGATIALTEETSTSAVLLRLLLEQRYGLAGLTYERVNTTAARPGEPEGRAGDALLLIGDEALRFRQTNNRYPFEVDIAFEWWLWQHLPCVFAVWAIRKDAPAEDKKELQRALSGSLGMSQSQYQAIAQERAPSLGVPAGELADYLGRFVYRFSAPEEEGIAQFRKLVDESHLL
jgi:chorismate dehydratase